jgi:hypothetical protein
MVSVERVLWECFRYFVHMDESNAAIHCAPVRYSPITFRLAEALEDHEARGLGCEPDADFAHLAQVVAASGAYAEDKGR